MARFGCLALAVVVAMALLIFIVFLWSGWLNRPVGHTPAAVSAAQDAPGAAPANEGAVSCWGITAFRPANAAALSWAGCPRYLA